MVSDRKKIDVCHKVESLKPYGPERSKTAQIEEVFDRIAQRYDLANRILSCGIDTIWRRHTVNYIKRLAPTRMLDLATGTGDMAIMTARALPSAHITAVDLSSEMLALAQKKAIKHRVQQRITFVKGDALHLPAADNRFDLVVSAFGLRNFENIIAGCREIHRVLRPGGKVVILELSRPQTGLLARVFDFYLNSIIPLAEQLFTGRRCEYTYLQRSIECVPQDDEMLELLGCVGLTNCYQKTYTRGICSQYNAEKGFAIGHGFNR
jgi:demethylmenaquinone methyltransferase / 2-methoxy-6-polyprenyl-1,4-benzoquinol methylase